MESALNKDRKPGVYRRFLRRLESLNPKKGRIFEVNAGPFGGDDGEQYMQAYKKTIGELERRLAQINSPSRKILNETIKLLSESETTGEGKNLMSENMTRKAESIIRNARENGSKAITIAVTDETYLHDKEEDYKLYKKIQELAPDIPCFLTTVTQMQESFLLGTFRKLGRPEIRALPDETFVYNDFTGPELQKYCEEHNFDFKKILNELLKIKKLDPIDIEHLTDRNFIEDLNLNFRRFPLLRPPYKKRELSYSSLPNGKIQFYRNNKPINLENLILKRTGTFGGNVKIFNHHNSELSFDEFDLAEMLNDSDTDFYLEEISKLPHIKVNVDLQKTGENSKESKVLYKHILKRQEYELHVLVPLGLLYNIICVFLIYFYPSTFLDLHYHVLLVSIQLAFGLVVMSDTIKSFKQRSILITSCISEN
jgi:hypothetical protein